jgi:hypothetical protein
MPYALLLLATATDPPPSENDVKAGWGALGLMLLLIAAVVFLLWSFTRQIKKVRAAQEAGVYGDDDDPIAQAPQPGRDADHPVDRPGL